MSKGEVRMLPGAERALDAAKFVHEASSAGARGAIVAMVDESGAVDIRVFGQVKRHELAWTGCVLSEHSVNGDFE